MNEDYTDIPKYFTVKWDQKFSEASLEDLMIAIMKLKTKEGLAICLCPEDVLQEWVAVQFPKNPWQPLRNCNI